MHADVGKHPDQLLHRRAVCLPSVDRLCAPGDVRDHVWVVDLVQRLPVARVEEIVTLCHEREQVLGPARLLGCGSHEVWGANIPDSHPGLHLLGFAAAPPLWISSCVGRWAGSAAVPPSVPWSLRTPSFVTR